MAGKGGRTDAEGRWIGTRIRLGRITGEAGPAGPPGLTREVWRGAWADSTDYHMGDLVYRDHGLGGGLVRTYVCMEAHTSAGDGPTPGGTTYWHEFNASDLIIDGSRAMVGDLDMGHNDVNNAYDVEVEHNETFTGGVGAAVVNDPRVIHMAGDDDDNEARIDGLERVVFNDEPTKSVIQRPSVVEFNTTVDQGVDTTAKQGALGYDKRELMLASYLRSVSAIVGLESDQLYKVAVGWGFYQAGMLEPDGPNPFPAATVVYASDEHFTGVENILGVRVWQAGSDSPPPVLDLAHRSMGITVGPSSHAQLVGVLQRGLYRTTGTLSGTPGDKVWASTDGSLTLVEPDKDTPIIFVGTIIRDESETLIIAVNVTPLPSLSELSHMERVTPGTYYVPWFDVDNGYWTPALLPAVGVTYDPTASELDATDVQAAIDELTKRTDYVGLFLFMGA